MLPACWVGDRRTGFPQCGDLALASPVLMRSPCPGPTPPADILCPNPRPHLWGQLQEGGLRGRVGQHHFAPHLRAVLQHDSLDVPFVAHQHCSHRLEPPEAGPGNPPGRKTQVGAWGVSSLLLVDAHSFPIWTHAGPAAVHPLQRKGSALMGLRGQSLQRGWSGEQDLVDSCSAINRLRKLAP